LKGGLVLKEPYECIDVGSDYCPCYLAETNDCITCSILQGESFCNCNWRGVCVYHEYTCNGNEKKSTRKHFNCEVLEKTKLNENSYIMKLKVSKTLARELREPGAYIFLRGGNLPQYFDLPMSIMDSNVLEGYITVAYQVFGTKTKIQIIYCFITIGGVLWNFF